jgi:uncharacterized protein YndB with AHSA1/START domain
MVEVTSSGTAKVTLPSDEEFLITREFDAPKHLVYEAWTTPELVERWWPGLRGDVNTEVFEGTPEGDSEPALNIVSFNEVDGRTTLSLLTQVSSKEVRDMIIDTGMEAGMQEGMDLLEQLAISLR